MSTFIKNNFTTEPSPKSSEGREQRKQKQTVPETDPDPPLAPKELQNDNSPKSQRKNPIPNLYPESEIKTVR